MNDSHYRRAAVDTAPNEAGGSFNDPEVLAKLTAVGIYIKFPGPEIKHSSKVIGSVIAIVPAINETQDLVMPVPVFPLQGRVHRVLHLIKVANLSNH